MERLLLPLYIFLHVRDFLATVKARLVLLWLLPTMQITFYHLSSVTTSFIGRTSDLIVLVHTQH